MNALGEAHVGCSSIYRLENTPCTRGELGAECGAVWPRMPATNSLCLSTTLYDDHLYTRGCLGIRVAGAAASVAVLLLFSLAKHAWVLALEVRIPEDE